MHLMRVNARASTFMAMQLHGGVSPQGVTHAPARHDRGKSSFSGQHPVCRAAMFPLFADRFHRAPFLWIMQTGSRGGLMSACRSRIFHRLMTGPGFACGGHRFMPWGEGSTPHMVSFQAIMQDAHPDRVLAQTAKPCHMKSALAFRSITLWAA